MGAVKGLSYDVDVAAMRAGSKPRAAQLERFWIKAPEANATHPEDGRFHDSEDVGGKIYSVSFEAGLAIYKAIFDGASIAIGLKRIEERGDRIYFGKVDMSEAEKQQAIGCLVELTK
jgi:hypothetical protein